MFARKLIRPFGDIKVEDISNEIRAVEKLCTPGTHKNIVAVTKHGKLPPSYYFLDMELCDLSLEAFIEQKWTAPMRETVPYFTANPPPLKRMAQIWDIMVDLSRGVSFIHAHGEVHRDLKPRNSTFFSCQILNKHSTLFSPRSILENRRFRVNHRRDVRSSYHKVFERDQQLPSPRNGGIR